MTVQTAGSLESNTLKSRVSSCDFASSDLCGDMLRELSSKNIPHINHCLLLVWSETLQLKLFSAGMFISGTAALNLEKEALSDEMLLIVAAELIVNVPSCSA